MSSTQNHAEPAASVLPDALELLSFDEFMKRSGGQPEWLVEGLIPSRGYVLLIGEPMVGKTTFVAELIAALMECCTKSKDSTFLGRSINGGRVLYAHLEHDGTSFGTNFISMLESRGVGRADLGQNLRLVTEFALDDEDYVQQLRDRLDKEGVRVVIIDSLRRAVDGNENDSGDTSRWAKNVMQLTKGAERLVIVLHHTGKSIDAGARGSTDLKAQADSILKLTRGPKGSMRLRAEHHLGSPVDLRYSLATDSGEAGISKILGLNVVSDNTVDDESGSELEIEHIKGLLAPGVELSTHKIHVLMRKMKGWAGRHDSLLPVLEQAEKDGILKSKRKGVATYWLSANSSNPATSLPG